MYITDNITLVQIYKPSYVSFSKFVRWEHNMILGGEEQNKAMVSKQAGNYICQILNTNNLQSCFIQRWAIALVLSTVQYCLL